MIPVDTNMLECLFPKTNGKIVSEALCSPPHWRTSSKPFSSTAFKSSAMAPMVEMLVYSRECGALVLSPCRVRSTIEDRKHLYRWTATKNRLDGCSNYNNATSKLLFEAKLASDSINQSLKLQDTAEYTCKLLENAGDLNGNFSMPIIGSGGFGSVFVSIYNNRKVAIKQLHCRRHSSSLDFWTLCAELNAFRLPRSPNVAAVISFILCDPLIQIVTEYVDGRNLQRLINDDQWCIDSNDRKNIALQIANGLTHCHAHRLLHLDIKPSNVLLSDDMSICKLTDFGCSRIATETSAGCLMARKAVTTSSFGTIAYKAPELLKNGHPTDRADIYSFSVLLYELLSRSEPYPGFHPHAIIFLVAGRNMRPNVDSVRRKLAKEGVNKIDDGLLNIMEKCWAPDYPSRPSASSVCQLIRDLSES